jgi:hypothetical protein
MDELSFTRDMDFNEVDIRDSSDHPVAPSVIEHDGVQFRIPASAVEQILKVARLYADMREETSDLDVMQGAPIMEGDTILGYADGIPCYRFTTIPCFTNVETITIDGRTGGFEADWTDVVIWDGGRGITFICQGADGYELAYGGGVHDFELFLKEAADNIPSPSTPA